VGCYMFFRRALVVMAIGNHYKKILTRRRLDLKNYAKKCSADLIEISENLDKTDNPRPPLDQKLLIPYHLMHFDQLGFLDLDVLISSKAPSIFDVNPMIGFSAVPTLYSEKYVRVCKRYFGIDPLNHHNYFSQRGVENSDNFFSINGGVWVCRPKIVAEYLNNAYWRLKKNVVDYNEPCADELNFAYETQLRGDFSALDIRFNHKILYDLYGIDEYYKKIAKSIPFKIIKNLEYRHPNLPLKYPGIYNDIIDKALSANWFVHFAGKLPYLSYNNLKNF